MPIWRYKPACFFLGGIAFACMQLMGPSVRAAQPVVPSVPNSVGLSVAPVSASSAALCGPPHLPATTLEFIHQEPMLDRHRSVRWLNSRAGGSPSYLVTGLTEYELQASFDMRLDPRDIGAGRYCLVPARVSPRVEVVKHLVYIASELERGSCEYDAVYAHEGEHVKINQRMEADMRAELDDMVQDIARNVAAIAPVSAENVPSTIRRLLSEYGREFKRRLRNVDRVRRNDHSRIDTPAEYEKLSRACGPNSAFQTTLPAMLR